MNIHGRCRPLQTPPVSHSLVRCSVVGALSPRRPPAPLSGLHRASAGAQGLTSPLCIDPGLPSDDRSKQSRTDSLPQGDRCAQRSRCHSLSSLDTPACSLSHYRTRTAAMLSVRQSGLSPQVSASCDGPQCSATPPLCTGVLLRVGQAIQ